MDNQFLVFGHCASGYRELWDIVATKEAAVTLGRKVLADSPATRREDGSVDTEGGGVVWVEIFGPGIEESIGVEMVNGAVQVIEP